MTDVIDEIIEAFNDQKDDSGKLAIQARQGSVTISVIEKGEQDGVVYVDVYLGDSSSDPHYRIINPPVLVPDRNGLIMIDESVDQDESRMKTYRRDPLAALAEVITTHRGSS